MNEDVFQKAINLIPQVRADLLRQIPFELQLEIGLQMNRTNPGDKSKNKTKVLNLRTGNLYRSFTKGNPANILKSTSKGVEFGSKVPYAAIHEYGGVINHPGTKNGFGKGIPIPPHSIPIPQRPYLAPALKAFEEDGLNPLVYKVFAPIRALFV